MRIGKAELKKKTRQKGCHSKSSFSKQENNFTDRSSLFRPTDECYTICAIVRQLMRGDVFHSTQLSQRSSKVSIGRYVVSQNDNPGWWKHIVVPGLVLISSFRRLYRNA